MSYALPSSNPRIDRTSCSFPLLISPLSRNITPWFSFCLLAPHGLQLLCWNRYLSPLPPPLTCNTFLSALHSFFLPLPTKGVLSAFIGGTGRHVFWSELLVSSNFIKILQSRDLLVVVNCQRFLVSGY
jgi:hypothetical protein